MESSSILHDPERLAALKSLGLVDSLPESGFDRLTELAVQVFNVPVALVSLVDDKRQFFKSCFGLPEPYATSRETPHSHSFCKHVVQTGKPLVVPDAREHPELKSNPAVTELSVIAYAGVPLVSADGQRLGSLCVIDNEPRQWTGEDIRILRCMGDCVQTEIESKDRFAKQNLELQQATEVARRKNIFLAQLSHELRNPLSPILNAAQMLCEGRLEEDEKPPIYELLRDQTLQVVRMVNDMLDLSRVEQGKMRIDKKLVDLHSVVESSVNAVRSSAIEQGHSIKVRRCVEPLLVLGDFDRLVQIVNNLLTNACRYTPEGGVVSVASAQVGDQATICVTDNGVGIPKDQLDEVFKVFNQVEPTERSKQGLGLGLALVRQLVTLHGGTVGVESEGLDQGSEFKISVPMCDEATLKDSHVVVAEQEAEESPSSAARFKILIIEDIHAVAFMFQRLLESAGHSVRVAQHAEEARELIAADKPEVIFSDIGLPGMNGFEFAAELSADKVLGLIPLIAMTGSSRNQDVKRATSAGFDYFLSKPIDINEVRDVIQKISEKA